MVGLHRPVTSIEQQVGAYSRLHLLFEDFAERDVLDFDDEAARRYRQRTRSRVRIAAIALTRDAIRLSRNLRDYQRVPGLRVEDWTAEALP